MERTASPFHRLQATALATATTLALVAGSFGPAAHAAARTPADAADAGVPTARPRGTPVTLNFVNADIEAVSRAIGAMLDREIVVDPRVKGTITVYNDKPQPLASAYRNYLSSLRGLGFTVVDAGGLLKVVPEADAKLQTAVVSVGAPSQRGDQVLTQIFHLNHENPNNLVAVLRPLITANNTINASPGNNSLVITDYADNLQRLGKIIAALDQPAGSELEVVPLKNAVASDLVTIVQKLIDGASATTPGAPNVAGQGAGVATVVAESRSNSLIVRAPNASRMANARMIIEKLDQPTQGGGPAGNIYVVYLKNADATRMAEVLRAAIAAGNVGGAAGGGGGSVPSSSGATGRDASTGPVQTTTTSSSSSGTSTASAQSTNPVAASPRPSTGGQVQADPATNSLIITASEPLYRQMRAVIDQLDVRRAQVYVESLMIQVDATKAAEFGFQWQGLFGAGSSSYIGAGTNFNTNSNNIIDLNVGAGSLASGTTSTSTSTTTTASSLLGNGLNIGFAPKINGIYTLAALAHFLETNAGGNVLSTPNLVALDNEEAKIVVGQNIPLVTGSYTNTGTTSTGTVNPFQTVERQDVGITLRIKSQIGENGTVRMTIYEENSSVSTSNSQVTNKTSVETFVTVDDGSLIVLGGLMKDEYGDSTSGVPGLASIPIIGNLFKSSGRTRTKSNLLLFLRPVVIRTQADADRLSINRYDAIRTQQQAMLPDKSIVMKVNDTPVVPALRPDTHVDESVPQDPGTGSLQMPSPAPVPDLRQRPAAPAPAAPASVPAAGAAPAVPGKTVTTTTTTTTVAPAPAPAPALNVTQ